MENAALKQTEQLAIRSVYRTLAAQSGSFTSRPQQLALIGLVARTTASGRIALCEAPTAVGKSLGYLVPVMTLAATRQTRVVVATATVVLQEQLLERDVPRVQTALREALGVSVPVAVLKGRSRYVCPVLLDHHTSQQDMFLDSETRKGLSALADAMRGEAWDGDFDSAPVKLPRITLKQVANDRNHCAGKACPRYNDCPYPLAIQKCRAARVVVTNHDMLLRMINTADVETLPPLSDATLIFDEAHHLPDKAMDALAARFDTVQPWLDVAIDRYSREDSGKSDTVRRYRAVAERAVNRAVRILEREAVRNSRIVHIDAALAAKVEAPLREAMHGYRQIGDSMETFNAAIKEKGTSGGKRRALHLRDIINVGDANRIAGVIAALDEYLAEDDPSLPSARWAERTASGWTFCRTPFEPGGILRRRLWDKVHAAVAVSATLAPSSGFGPTLHRFGLLANKRVETMSLDSPLDYSRSRLIVPRLEATPDKSEEHTREVVATVLQIDRDEGGVLVLFSSRRQLLAAESTLRHALGDALLVQGSAPVAGLLARHAQRVNSGLPSVLMGMQSFGEGLDLPGRLCVAVVIDKIPFPAADDPILKAASEHLRAKGREPFGLLILPAASITLKQNVGRLVRAQGDGGTVYLLDSRARTRTYGRQLLAGLPMQSVFP